MTRFALDADAGGMLRASLRAVSVAAVQIG